MSIKKLLLLIFILVVLLVVTQALVHAVGAGRSYSPGPLVLSQSSNVAVNAPPPQPPATAADTIAQQNKHLFSVLVSYTNSGFEPAIAHIHAGVTVRFTNNSTANVWIAASGSQLYPRTQNDCGSSDLDTCGQLKPGEFWQFTFTKKGTWQYVNNLDKTKQGTIIVQ